MNLHISPIVLKCSASSSGISIPNSSSRAIITSTVSKESASKSSVKEVSKVIVSTSSIDNCYEIIDLIFSNILSSYK